MYTRICIKTTHCFKQEGLLSANTTRFTARKNVATINPAKLPDSRLAEELLNFTMTAPISKRQATWLEAIIYRLVEVQKKSKILIWKKYPTMKILSQPPNYVTSLAS